MATTRSNIILIGMPGSGKSTVGVVLAKQTLLNFVDTDVLIQTLHDRTLQDIVDRDGYAELRRIEEDVLLGLSAHHSVIATGGSAIYGERAMAHLKSHGVVIFLEADLATLEARVHDFGSRGLAKRADQNFVDLFNERAPLYAKYADITINSSGMIHEEVCAGIIEILKTKQQHKLN